MHSEPHWLIGLESSARSDGAVHFARWLRGSLGGPVVGLHVSELWMLVLAEPGAAEYMATAREATERWLATLKSGTADAAFDGVELIDAVDAEHELARRGQGALGIVVGRYLAGESGWIRLGRVSRRLLRSLPAPVIVAPPELTADAFHGPVVLATDLGPASVAAVRFAARFARQAGRPLVCAHIGQPRWHSDVELLPRWKALRDAYRAKVEREARAWVAEHCPDTELVLDYGAPGALLPALAERRQASLLVLGSRRLGLVDRLVDGSIASAAASIATCAVAVVPMDEAAINPAMETA